MAPIFYGWWIVFASFIIAFYVAGILFYGFTAFVEPLIAEFGWSYAQVSLAASLRGLEMGIMAPFVGFLVDRFGSRRLLFAGVIILGFGIILLGFTDSLLMFYGAFILMAFGAGGCTSVVTMTAIANWFDKNVGKAMGIMVSGFGASGLVIPLLVWLISTYGWRNASFILGIATWVLLIPLAFIIRDKPEEMGYAPDGAVSEDASDQKDEAPVAKYPGFREVLTQRTFLCVNAAETIRLMVLATVVTHIMPYLATMGFSRTTAGLVAAGIPLFSILGRFGFGWMGDVIDKKYVMAMAYVLMGVGTLALGYIDVKGSLWIFLLLFSNGFGGISVVRGALLREYYGREFFGKLIGIMMGFGAMGGIIGPTVAGWVFDHMNTYHYVWLVFSGLIGISMLLVLCVEPRAAKHRIP